MTAIRGTQSPFYEAVILNAGAAIYVAGMEPDVKSGIARAREVTSNGLAEAKLRSLVEISRTDSAGPAQA